MNCDNCIQNNFCLKPWESPKDCQEQHFGRTFTKEQWETEGYCYYYQPYSELVKKENK